MAAIGRPADLIGFHGQTILHRPAQRRTWQIGDAELLSARTGLPVAHDFRSADVAAGGQGAPLIPVFHAVLAAGLERPLAFLNIGGVANVTFIGTQELLAFDTGPGNGPLDDLVARHFGDTCDRDGRYSAAGIADPAVLLPAAGRSRISRARRRNRWTGWTFAASLARSGLSALAPADAAATLVAFTAGAVAAAPAARAAAALAGRRRRTP